MKNSWIQRIKKLEISNRIFATLVVLSIIATTFEVFGLSIFLPIFQFIKMDGNIDALVLDSYIWKYLVNIFSYLGITPSLTVLLIAAFLLFAMRQLVNYFRMLYEVSVKQNSIQKQRSLIFGKYLEADTSYHDVVPVGNFVNVLMREVDAAVAGAMIPINIVVSLIILFSYTGLLFVLSWEVTLFALIVLVISSVLPRVWIRESAKVGRKLVNSNTALTEFLVGRLRSPRLVRLSGTGRAERKNFYDISLKQKDSRIHSCILQLKTDLTIEPFVVGLSLLFLYFSYTLLHLTIETIGLYLLIILRLIPIIRTVIMQVQNIQQLLGSIEILEKRFQEITNSLEQDFGRKNLKKINYSLKFDNVSFSYSRYGDKYALKGISINIKANEVVAIVGPSGGGKSTLIDLIPRLRKPSKGDIYIDGVNYEEYTLESVRSLISYAPQSPQIFTGTIRDHIIYGKSGVTNAEIQKTLYLSGSKHFVDNLPNGLDTILDEDAINLSGGQIQRLDLARALIKNAPILILDEPTSNLDIESEELFNKAIRKIHNETNIMIIIVTHTLTGVVHADKIVVLNNGVIENIGTHKNLINNNKWYSNACDLQRIAG